MTNTKQLFLSAVNDVTKNVSELTILLQKLGLAVPAVVKGFAAKRREFLVEYRAKNRERLRAAARAYYIANREKILKKTRIHAAAHRDSLREYWRTYKAANKERIAAKKAQANILATTNAEKK